MLADHTTRSIDPADYQFLPQAIGAMPKRFPDGHVIAPHEHVRDQLIYCVKGVMRIETDLATLTAPPDRAVYLPAGMRHSIRMHGLVEMRTLYIDPSAARRTPPTLEAVTVSSLLRELIVALCQEPVVYEQDSRGDLIARLIEDELARSQDYALIAPLPRDPRLQKLCASLIAAPDDRRTLEDWAPHAGASARTLARLFESDLGMSFRDWRRRIRIQRAIEALDRGDPVDQVAYGVGYRSSSAFAAAFRAVMGAPPSTFRQDA